jgi:hypothetical protein
VTAGDPAEPMRPVEGEIQTSFFLANLSCVLGSVHFVQSLRLDIVRGIDAPNVSVTNPRTDLQSAYRFNLPGPSHGATKVLLGTVRVGKEIHAAKTDEPEPRRIQDTYALSFAWGGCLAH